MISIIIPTYEAGGRGIEFLDWNLKKISEQTYIDYEILVSDHSLNFNIQRYVEKQDNKKLKYLRCTKKRGFVGANIYYATQFAKGEIIKPMFMDDYFYNKEALNNINSILSVYQWIAIGCNHTKDRKTYYNEHIPTWNENILKGENTISSPSCIAYIKQSLVEWNENKRWLVDCDFYYKCWLVWGIPILYAHIMVTNYIHPEQMTNKLTNEEKQKEIENARL